MTRIRHRNGDGMNHGLPKIARIQGFGAAISSAAVDLPLNLKPGLRSTKDTKSTKGQTVVEVASFTQQVTRENFASRSFRGVSCFPWTLHGLFQAKSGDGDTHARAQRPEASDDSCTAQSFTHWVGSLAPAFRSQHPALCSLARDVRGRSGTQTDFHPSFHRPSGTERASRMAPHLILKSGIGTTDSTDSTD
jgi:hypothetical protein